MKRRIKKKSVFLPWWWRSEFWLGVILLIGLVIRVYQISPALLEEITNRQLIDAWITRQLNSQGLANLGLGVYGFPLYHFLVVNVYRLVGGTWEMGGRLLSVFFSILAGFWFYKLLNLFGSRRQALMGLALFYLMSPVHIIISRSFLIDEMTLWLAIMAVYFGALWHQHRRQVFYLASLVFMAVTWLSKYTFGYVILPVLWWLGTAKIATDKRRLMRMGLYIVVTLLPSVWWYLYAKQYNEWLYGGPTGEWVVSFIFDPNNLISPGYYVNIFSHFARYALTPAWLPLVFLGMIMKYKREAMIPFYLWFVGALGFIFTFNIASRTHSYYFLAFVAPAAFFAATALDKLVDKFRFQLGLLNFPVIIVMLLLGLSAVVSDEFLKAYRTYQPSHRIPLVGRLTQLVTATNTPIAVSANRNEGVIYFADRPGYELRLGPITDEEAVIQLEQLRSKGVKRYVVYDTDELISKPGLAKYVETNYRKIFDSPDMPTLIYSLCAGRKRNC